VAERTICQVKRRREDDFPVRVVILLAAGEGTRMRSDVPKVLHSILGRTLIGHVLTATESLNASTRIVVIGAKSEEVRSEISRYHNDIATVLQDRRGGTGHAVRIALGEVDLHDNAVVLVVAGDAPLITGDTLNKLASVCERENAGAVVLTADVDDPRGYGRVIRDPDNGILRIVEDKDANEDEREVHEVNSSIYAFRAGALKSALAEIKPNNAQGEEYLTDVIEIIRARGMKVIPVVAQDYFEILGVNDRIQLAEATAIMRDRVNLHLMASGVTLIDPPTTFIDVTVSVEPEVTIKPGCQLEGVTTVGKGALIGPDTRLFNCTVGPEAVITKSECDGATIGRHAHVGPYSFLRPGAHLADGAKVGSFVEVKNSTIGAGSKVPHLSYIGDATIGVESNIGAGTITANYDGVAKHQTIIGDHVRIGSDNILIAPVEIGDGAYTAAGSAITENVPPGAMGVGRGQQRNILGWVKRKRAGSDSAKAADRASSQEK
jgi:bifunctional UDP-N-acetylglucosamine pyrophosphorylase/glucosamine-1-phosphate N-acetyltransferase